MSNVFILFLLLLLLTLFKLNVLFINLFEVGTFISSEILFVFNELLFSIFIVLFFFDVIVLLLLFIFKDLIEIVSEF